MLREVTIIYIVQNTLKYRNIFMSNKNLPKVGSEQQQFENINMYAFQFENRIVAMLGVIF